MAVPVRLICILVLVPVLAGCSGKSADPVQDDEGVVIDEDENIVVAPELGAVRGVVRSDQGSLVPGARVQLVGTSLFHETGNDGRFLFVNVTPPEATVRVEAQGFRVWERPVDVEAGRVTSVNVTLLSDLGLDPDLRPHAHNMWNGQESVTLLDGRVPFTRFDPADASTAPSATTTLTAANAERRNTANYDVPIPLPDAVHDDDMPNDWPALVYPGAVRVEVTLDWDVPQDSSLDQLALAYHNATSSTREYLDLKGPGETWVIALDDPFSTDRGHQEFSLWGFYVNSLNEVTSAGGTYRGPGHYLGGFHAKIEVFRGPEIPLEPAHPDFWGDNASVVLRTADRPHELNIGVGAFHRDHRDLGGFDININGAIVPPGTKSLRLDFSWRHGTADGTVPGIPWVLTWRSADQNPIVTTLDQYHRAAPVEGSPDEQHMVYEFDIDPGQADAYYQTDSRWGFLLSMEGREDDTWYFQEHRWRGDNAGLQFFLEVTAFR